MLLSVGDAGDPCGTPLRSRRARFVRRLPPFAVVLFHWHGQPRLDEAEQAPVAHAPGHALHQLGVGDLTEIVREIAIYHFVVAPVEEPVDVSDRIQGASFRPVTVLLGFQVGLKDRPQYKHGRCLRHPVPHGWYTQRPELAGLFLRDQDLAHRLRRIGPFPQIPRQFPEPSLHTVRLDVTEALPVDPGLAAVAASQSPGLPEKVLPPHLVAQGMKAPSGFFLRFCM